MALAKTPRPLDFSELTRLGNLINRARLTGQIHAWPEPKPGETVGENWPEFEISVDPALEGNDPTRCSIDLYLKSKEG